MKENSRIERARHPASENLSNRIRLNLRIGRQRVGRGLAQSAEFRAALNRIADPARAIEAITAFYRPLIERLAA